MIKAHFRRNPIALRYTLKPGDGLVQITFAIKGRPSPHWKSRAKGILPPDTPSIFFANGTCCKIQFYIALKYKMETYAA